jgi:hypothetical protein
MKLQVPYGYNTFIIDNLLCVYTAKIRVKIASYSPSDALEAVLQKFTITKGKNDCIIISYAVTSSIENAQNIEIINTLLCDIMHKRIDAKYQPQWQKVENFFEESDLPY